MSLSPKARFTSSPRNSGGRIRPADNFVRALHVVARGALDYGSDPAKVAASLYPGDEVTPLLVRAAVSPATTTSSGWAGVVAQQAVADFVDSIAPISAASRLMNAGLTLDMAGVNTIGVPRRNGAPDPNLTWVDQAAPAPVRSYLLASTTLGPMRKLLAIVVLTHEMVTFASGEEMVRTVIREDVAASLDATVFSNLAATTARPAGLLNGVTATTAATGGGTEAMLKDLAALAGAVAAAGGSGQVAFVMNPVQATVAGLRLQSAQAQTIWPSQGVPAGTVIAVDPTAFVSGFGPEPRIEASQEALIHAEDTTPLPIGTAATTNTVAAPTRSLFQTDCIGIRALLDVAYAMRQPGLVAWTSSVTW